MLPRCHGSKVFPPLCGGNTCGCALLYTARILAPGALDAHRELCCRRRPRDREHAAIPIPTVCFTYLAYNDRQVNYNKPYSQGEQQRQDSHLQRANWCTIVLCEIPPCQLSFAGCAFHFSRGLPENRNRRVQIRTSTILDPTRARPERHHALDQSRVRRPIP